MTSTDIAPTNQKTLVAGSVSLTLPALIIGAGERASKRFLEYFTATIRNKNTREAYARAVRDFFAWCETNQIGPLIDIEPVHIAAYIEQMTSNRSAPTVKQHLAAINRLFDFLVTGGILDRNPAASVTGPKHSQTKGKTPVLFAEDARALIKSIPSDSLPGLRDRAIISVMTYAFARVSATLAMDVKDVIPQHRRLWLRLKEKGGKHIEIPCHHNLEEYLHAYLNASGLTEGPLFPTFRGRSGKLTAKRLHRTECLLMIKRRAKQAGLATPGICNHTFRGTGITAYLSNPDARLELAQQLAGHSDPKTTRMYDRRSDEISLDEVEKIGI